MKAIVIHGGAGRWEDKDLKEALEVMEESLKRGMEVLKGGRSSLDAVETAIKVMEDSPLFNAGLGSALTLDGKIEMDACVVVDEPRTIGAVIGVDGVKNPISLARLIAERTDHCIMHGEGAKRLAEVFGLEFSFLITERAKERLEKIKRKLLEGELEEKEFFRRTAELMRRYPELFTGTVGAVATDGKSVCAGTSTGGSHIKLYGRVGDTPIPGAGTWAERGVGASATGIGEGIIKVLLTKTLVDYVLRDGVSINEACKLAVQRTEYPAGAIALDIRGVHGCYHNTDKMPYGYANERGEFILRYSCKESS
ncbi:asparaginase [Hydrogenivirga caldilitoris]|uniref:Asparaginase n=1 Tax=Hydrogenivirga caldilitoris TaxID=246264 RepID=A0A497XP09_9AQUI|nr:isoaspartyl peptidase/L-asparaginase [Hydrogenivirga caldilitoris]RLJ69870.1 asparaginase [Hydrogenivirga caldilitoris]